MSRHSASLSGTHRRAAFILAALFAFIATARPGLAAYCCTMGQACCPGDVAARDGDRTEMRTPVPQCCQQLVPGHRLPLFGRTSEARSAPVIAVLPNSAPHEVVTPVTLLAPERIAAGPADPPSSPREARAPPLS